MGCHRIFWPAGEKNTEKRCGWQKGVQVTSREQVKNNQTRQYMCIYVNIMAFPLIDFSILTIYSLHTTIFILHFSSFNYSGSVNCALLAMSVLQGKLIEKYSFNCGIKSIHSSIHQVF